MANETLRRALADARLTERELAERIGAHPVTVSSWVTDPHRTPQPRLRRQVADVLKVDEMSLWPQIRTALKTGPDREIVTVYPTRSAMPTAVWERMIDDARTEIALCQYSSTILWTLIPDLSGTLRAKAESGCRVRVITGDPTSPFVTADEAATDVPLTLTSRIEQTRYLLEPLRDVVEVRASGLGFGRSLFRGDNEALLSIWPHGIWGGDYPVFHLRRRQDGGVFDQMAVKHVEALWEDATPVWS
jgi:hypothetical protein